MSECQQAEHDKKFDPGLANLAVLDQARTRSACRHHSCPSCMQRLSIRPNVIHASSCSNQLLHCCIALHLTAFSVCLSARTSDPSTRGAALALMVASVEGLGTGDRSAEAIQTQALKSVLKTLKDFSDAATLTAASSVLQVVWQRQSMTCCLLLGLAHGCCMNLWPKCGACL